jgi:hypothetical protein
MRPMWGRGNWVAGAARRKFSAVKQHAAMKLNDLTSASIGASMKVPRTLGPGLLESVKQAYWFLLGLSCLGWTSWMPGKHSESAFFKGMAGQMNVFSKDSLALRCLRKRNSQSTFDPNWPLKTQ